MYAQETTSAIILWGNVTRLWICLLLERGNILFPKCPFGIIFGQVTALQLSILISKKKNQWCNHIDSKVVQFSGALYKHFHPISFEVGIRCFTVFFLLGRLMVSLSVSFSRSFQLFSVQFVPNMCQFFLFRSNYRIIWDYLVCQQWSKMDFTC